MKNFTSSLLALGVFIICSTAHAQMGIQKWNFVNRREVRQAVRQNVNNLRASYEIIICARRQGMIASAVQEYESLIGNKPFDAPAKLSSSYAFAHCLLNTPIGWNIPYDYAPVVKDGPDAGLKVSFFRDRALKALPRSPEVLLEYAIWQGMSFREERKEGLRLIQQVVALSPKWADAHYWHAQLTEYYAIAFTSEKESQKPRYGRMALAALNQAERLDPAFKKTDLSFKSDLYSLAGKSKEALIAFDTYNQMNPGFAVYRDKVFGKGQFQKWRKSLVAAAK